MNVDGAQNVDGEIQETPREADSEPAILFDSSGDEDESSCPAVPRPSDEVAADLALRRLGRILD
eukprot:11161111-Lingulodinium_polyedra.AAC.1